VDLSESVSKNMSRHSEDRMREFEKRNVTIPMALMRYVPFIHHILEGFLRGRLDEEDYPWVAPPPEGVPLAAGGNTRPAATSRATRRAGWRHKVTADDEDKAAVKKSGSSKEENDNRQRYLVFMIGGLTFSETRSVYELASSTDANLYIGSTSMMNAASFLRNLADLDDDANLELEAKKTAGESSSAARMARKSEAPAAAPTATPETGKEKDRKRDRDAKKDTGKEGRKERGRKKEAKKTARSDSDDDSDDERSRRAKADSDFKKISLQFQ